MTVPPDLDDDPSIENTEDLWRRIFPLWWVHDANLGRTRLSTAAFEDSKKPRSPMSVTIASECANADVLLADYDGYGLAAFTAGEARDCRQKVARTPTTDNQAHASVIGKKTGGVKNCLLRAARVLIEPT